jgi:hypothetical protein
MFVRFKKRKGEAWAVRLVESVRRSGKPRQRVVAHLGGVRRSGDTVRIPAGFAHKVKRTLFDLAADGTITPADADRFRTEIAERVGVDIRAYDPVVEAAGMRATRGWRGRDCFRLVARLR